MENEIILNQNIKIVINNQVVLVRNQRRIVKWIQTLLVCNIIIGLIAYFK